MMSLSKTGIHETHFTRQQAVTRLAVILSVTLIYFGAGKLGLSLAVVNPSASAVWPPTGIAVAATLLLGYGVWPAILLGAFLVNITTSGVVPVSLAIAAGNTLEALVGVYLINRFANGRSVFDRTQDIFKYAILVGVVSTSLSATVGVTSLALGGLASWADYWPIWLTWWLGDTVGALVVAPVLILWAMNPTIDWNRGRLLEAIALLVSLVFLSLFVFGGLEYSGGKDYPLKFVLLPIVGWSAYRFGQREAATSTLILSSIAIGSSLYGPHPSSRDPINEPFVVVQAFMGIAALTGLVLGAIVGERQRGAKALGESEERLRSILDNTTAVVQLLDTEQRYLFVNRQWETLFHLMKAEVVGKSVYDIFPKDIADALHTGNQAVFQARTSLEQEEVIPQDDGLHMYLSLKFPLYRATGEPYAVCIISTDITGRKRNEVMSLRLAAIVESSDDAIFSKTLDGTILSWNRGAERVYGYSPEEAIGRSVNMLAPADHRAEVAQILERLRRGERIDHLETNRVRKDGREIQVALSISPIRDETGSIIGASTIARDITERRRIERERKELLELEEKGKAIVARQSLELKSAVLDALAHDMKTPLTSIKAAITHLLSGSGQVGPLDVELLSVISEETNHLIRQVSEATYIARMETGVVPMEMGPFNLREPIHTALEELKSAVGGRLLQVQIPDELPPVEMDFRMIKEVTRQLLDNALKYSPADSLLSISCEQVDGAVIVHVVDSGSGIPAAEHTRIFEKFYRVNDWRHSVPGSGMGLWIAKRIMEAHGGEIWVTSQPDEGSAFHFSLPIQHRNQS